MDTCINLCEHNEALRKQIIEQANAFCKPTGRTADVIASIPVLTAQILVMTMLPADKSTATNADTQEVLKLDIDINQLGRFGTEEICRRMIKKDVTAPAGAQLMDYMYPDRGDMIEQYRHAYDQMLKDEVEQAQKGVSVDDAYAKYLAMAAMMKKDAGEDQSNDNDNKMEESKDDKGAASINKVDAQIKIDETLAAQVWLKQLEQGESKASKLVDTALNSFDKWQKQFINTVR